jgi:putative ABC transport system permease protein
MILLRLISWQYARKHLLRSLLTAAGIVLGVAVFTGMHTANRTVLGAFNHTVNRIAGKAQLQITAGDTGFGEQILERVQAIPEVRIAEPVIEAHVETGLQGQGSLLILAVDMTGDRGLRDYDLEGDDVIDDPLVFLAQPDSLIVTRTFAGRNGLAVNSRIRMDTMDGPKQFTIRGLLKPGGMSAAFGGNLAIMDIYAAQKVFGRGRRFDRIDLALQDGIALEQGQAAIRKALGPGLDVDPPSTRGAHFETLMSVYSTSVNVSSIFALFVGMFIIYNSFAIAVTQRRGEIGILRALGATRGQIRALFLGESAVAGLIGAIAGAALGLAAARQLAANTGKVMDTIVGAGLTQGEIELDPRVVIAALAMGIVTTMIAAWIPARNAARVDPVQALQKGKYQVLSAGENRVRTWLAIVTTAISAILLVTATAGALFYAGYALIFVAALLVTPAASSWLARALRAPLKHLRPVEGALAADSLLQAPRRTSATVAALMLSLAMVVGLAGMAGASFSSLEEWSAYTFNPDLFVGTSENLAKRSFQFPPEAGETLARLPFIDEVQAVRSVRLAFRDTRILLVAAPLEPIRRRTQGRRATMGDFNQMHHQAAAGKGVVVSENLAELQHLKLGDPVEFATPSGILRLPVVGAVRDYSNQLGTMFIDRSVYLRYWHDDTTDIFRVYLKPGVSSETAKEHITDALKGRTRVVVLLNRDLKKVVRDITDQWFGMTYVQIFISVLVAVLGIINTLTVSIADRRRELGVLRAVGGLRHQIRGTIWLEALAVGAIGLVLGLLLGAVNLYYQLEVLARGLVGMPLSYEFPYPMASWLIPTILTVSLVSAIGPGENAVRSSLVEALEYE